MAHRERKQLNFSTIVDFPSQNRVSFLSHSDKKLWQECVTAFFVVSLKNDELISPFFQTFFTVLSNT